MTVHQDTERIVREVIDRLARILESDPTAKRVILPRQTIAGVVEDLSDAIGDGSE